MLVEKPDFNMINYQLDFRKITKSIGIQLKITHCFYKPGVYTAAFSDPRE